MPAACRPSCPEADGRAGRGAKKAKHAWRAPEVQRNGDLVVPLLNAGGDVLPLRGSRLMWEQFAEAILKATRLERLARRKAKAGGAVRKPNGRLL